MSDQSTGGAPAPAAASPASAPIDTTQAHHAEPLGNHAPVADKAPEPVEAAKPAAKPEPKPEAKPEPSKTSREAIQKAHETLKAREAEKAASDKGAAEKPVEKVAKPEPAEKPQQAKDETTGRFVSKTPPAERKPYHEAPARFLDHAKRDWDAAPDTVKEEVHRAIKNLEEGHQKYRASHEAYEQVREFDETARRNGGNLRASLEKIVDFENTFARSPIEGFQKVADHFGIPLRAVAAHIMGQTPDQVQTRHEAVVRDLKSELATLKQQVSGVTKSFEEQRTSAVMQQVEAFTKDHPRFDELSEDIAFFLQSKRASTLSEAYELAERLNPAPAKASSPAPIISAEPAPLNPAGMKSITGAPSPGSSPSRQPPSSNNREALRRAAERVGRL
jgi:hypothetical protein